MCSGPDQGKSLPTELGNDNQISKPMSECDEDKRFTSDETIEMERNRMLKGKFSIEAREEEETAIHMASYDRRISTSMQYYDDGVDEGTYRHQDVDTWVDSAPEQRYWDSSFYGHPDEASYGDDNHSLCPMVERLSERSTDFLESEAGFYKEDIGSEFTGCVGTRWYRAPELLYGATNYGTGVDIWAMGCIFAEMMLGEPIFPGCSDIDQLSRIVRVLGNPNEERWPGVSNLPDYGKISFAIEDRDCVSLQKQIKDGSEEAHDLLSRVISYDPASRLSAMDALEHRYFQVEPTALPSSDLRVPSPCPSDNESTESL